jgi:hypothetical protein
LRDGWNYPGITSPHAFPLFLRVTGLCVEKHCRFFRRAGAALQCGIEVRMPSAPAGDETDRQCGPAKPGKEPADRREP